jgi:hypothetical protein
MTKNDAKISGKGKVPVNAENTNMHKLMKMGMSPDAGGKGKPTARP